MAIINNQLPTESEIPDGYTRRVVVKFRPDVELPYTDEASKEFQSRAPAEWSGLTESFAGITLTPYFSNIDQSTLESFKERSAQRESFFETPQNFLLYYAIEVPIGADAESVAKTVTEWEIVETAYVEAGPTPPPVNPSDDPRSANQGYLNAAPNGIDARWIWITGADGNNIGFVDLEQGWTLNHEDLSAANITVISGVSQAYRGHGTAVLGEVVGVDNTLGVVGIAPSADARVVSQWRTASTYNTAEAILSAVAAMSSGDVLLLEAQTSYPDAGGYVPVEVEQAVFDAIQYATSQGIIVVEAGANGSVDLDAFQDVNGKNILNRNSPDFRDSGAIMVGAGSSATPHARLSFSNFGSRIDCYAWGEDIDTTGDGWTGNLTNTYTTSFGGTSGASPIVTGAALLLQSWRVKKGKPRFTPGEMRQLLSDTALNTASQNPDADRIGVMPNLRAIIGSFYPRRKFYYEWAWAWMILIGGLLILPVDLICIRCGPAYPGYLGDTIVILLGVTSIGVGIAGIVRAFSKSERFP